MLDKQPEQIMILEILDIIRDAKNDEEGRIDVMNFVNQSKRSLRRDTMLILSARGFTSNDIPKLSALT